MRHQSNQWEGRRLSSTLCHHAGGGRHGCWCARRAFEGIGLAHAERIRLRRSWQRAMAEASEAFSVRERAGGRGRAAKQGALRREWPSERARARCAGVQASVFPEVWSTKKASPKILLPPWRCRLRRGRISVGS